MRATSEAPACGPPRSRVALALVAAAASMLAGRAAAWADLSVDATGAASPPSVRVDGEKDTPMPAAPGQRPNPRLKLSFRGFSIANLDDSPVSLSGLELDLFPFSTRWFRAGLTLDGGRGQGTFAGNHVSLRYGMAGFAGGFQYPAPVTPFIEGHVAAGVLRGDAQGPLGIAGSSITIESASAMTWMYVRGLDFGAEIYAVNRFYVSLSMGWQRSTWHGLDVPSGAVSTLAGLQPKDLTSDSFTFKVGVGL